MTFRKHTKIFTVLSFLRLRSPDIFWYQWIYPTLVFLLIFAGYHWFGDQVLSINKEKLIRDINSLMGILTGFYIAALAAVASFTNENLDKVMKGRAPILTTISQGKKHSEFLTRRRFLAILFGYCAILSIFLYFFGILQVNTTIIKPVRESWQLYITISRHFIFAVYIWTISSLLVVTLLGLHYLVERMHRE